MTYPNHPPKIQAADTNFSAHGSPCRSASLMIPVLYLFSQTCMASNSPEQSRVFSVFCSRSANCWAIRSPLGGMVAMTYPNHHTKLQNGLQNVGLENKQNSYFIVKWWYSGIIIWIWSKFNYFLKRLTDSQFLKEGISALQSHLQQSRVEERAER